MSRFPKIRPAALVYESTAARVFTSAAALAFALLVLPGFAYSFGRGAELLDQAAVARLLPAEPKTALPPCSDRQAWASPEVQTRLEPLRQRAQASLLQKMPAWSDADYLEFQKTGERLKGDTMQQRRKGWIRTLSLTECYENQGRFLRPLESALREIVRQPSWTLPSSDPNMEVFRGTRQFVELNSADLALVLADALALHQQRLNPQVVADVKLNLERRVFSPMRASFLDPKRHWWLTSPSNWNPACLAGVVGAALAVLPDRDDRALFAAAALRYSASYLSAGFADDGYSTEGLNYWNFGFGKFAKLRQGLALATGGAVDLFADPKARRIAEFGFNYEMFPGNSAAFGDSILGVKPNGDLLQYLSEAFGMGAGRIAIEPPTDELLSLFRSLVPKVAAAPVEQSSDNASRSFYFKSAGVLVARPQPGSATRLGVTVKAGGNTTHSHNDVGSFAIALGNEQPVGDPGGLKYYSGRSFGSARYESKFINSFGHPVPVVNGSLQVDASTIHPHVIDVSLGSDKDVMAIDLSSAYAVKGVRELVRKVEYSKQPPGAVRMEDRFGYLIPGTFETAIVTTGSYERLDQKTLLFSKGAERLTVSIEASGYLSISAENMQENGTEATRVSLRLASPAASGFIRLTYKPRSEQASER